MKDGLECEIEILGERRRATVHLAPIWDDGGRMRGLTPFAPSSVQKYPRGVRRGSDEGGRQPPFLHGINRR